ncbi:PREDICTED: uncharacterized protein LOC106103283 isoform X1 [Papilio polytes]|uniref:uncharacterized protein LOC106103283 isoform X1 n=1 Tax=Papilio polytes TaxID=76194 RepID=UPI0006760F9D|nr:PREDICTED: uncharacterized protein LOC106103283 isoform X1 [Papilio polytes]
MAPPYGYPNYDFVEQDSTDNDKSIDDNVGYSEMVFWYTIVLVAMLLLWILIFFCLRMISLSQKTRNPQQRRQYLGSRSRTSLPQPDPTVYVSPANLPPPPKYEAMAPPSYEEVVGIHYPNYQPPMQPIAQPIATAMAQNASANVDTEAATNRDNENPSNTQTTLTVTNERSNTAAVAVSS